MITLKIIIHELSTVPESLLLEVANFIKSAKVDAAVPTLQDCRSSGKSELCFLSMRMTKKLSLNYKEPFDRLR